MDIDQIVSYCLLAVLVAQLVYSLSWRAKWTWGKISVRGRVREFLVLGGLCLGAIWTGYVTFILLIPVTGLTWDILRIREAEKAQRDLGTR